jgi:hypothetical protein
VAVTLGDSAAVSAGAIVPPGLLCVEHEALRSTMTMTTIEIIRLTLPPTPGRR